MRDIETTNWDTENERTFYCQVETHRATKDYLQGGRCVRLIAVMPCDFSADMLLSGVTTYTIDIDFWQFCELDYGVSHWGNISSEERKQIEKRDDNPRLGSTWLRLEVKYLHRAKNYLYQTFSNDEPLFFDVVSLTPHPEGPVVPQLFVSPVVTARTSDAEEWPFDQQGSLGSHFVFDTFHVGQGMCSLVHDGSHGILLDMGAGKPVTRNAYHRKSINNDLYAILSSLKRLLLVISHADSDHWRILGWDPALLEKIDKIHAPAGAISLAMQDKAVSKNIHGLGNTTWHLNRSTTLQLWRSDPSFHDKNGTCLVAVFVRAGQRVLAPGDYVYERFISDTNPGINTLHNAKYSAVVVPHHGDEASGLHVVSPDSDAKAFFSAGTHQSWCHPTNHSLTAHRAANFKNISDPTQPNIVKVNLI